MKRTTTRRRREWAHFFEENRRLFPFVGLLLAGVLAGVLVYIAGRDSFPADISHLLRVTGVTGGLRKGLGALGSACFSTVVLLAALFLLGLWSCGAPFVLAVPLFYGLGLGLTEAYYFAMGGIGVRAVALVVMPRGLLAGVVLLMASVESLRLCTGLSRRLLPPTPDGSAQENLWPVFRLYCLRYLLFLLAAVAAGLMDVILRTVFARFLP